jgi:hypothetical protein
MVKAISGSVVRLLLASVSTWVPDENNRSR